MDLNNLQLGSFVLNGQLILYLSCGAAGWLILRHRLRNLPEKNSVLSYTLDAIGLWVIVWKGSYLVFHFVEFIQYPLSLLYFDGGVKGRWLATLAVLAYIWYRFSKLNLSFRVMVDIGVWFTFAGWTVYHVLLVIMSDHPAWFHSATAGLTVILLITMFISQIRTKNLKGIQFAIWFLIGNITLLFLVTERPLWLLSFSKQQIVLLVIAGFLTGWTWLDEKKQKGVFHE